MTNEFLKEINQKFGSDCEKNLDLAIKYISTIDFKNNIYNENFALKLADVLLENKMDYFSIFASLFYPMIKLKMVDKINQFDKPSDTEAIIIAITKIENLNVTTKQEQLDNIKEMFIAIAKDIRAIIVKLCAEQVKLDFFKYFNDDEKEILMKNNSEIFAPLSAMLGMSQVKNKLEDATFKYYKPKLYDELSKALSTYVEERNENIKYVIEKIKSEIASFVPHYEVYGRQKQLYSIAKKLQKKNMTVNTFMDVYGRNNFLNDLSKDLSFSQMSLTHILDVLAVRVLVDTVDECYAVLGRIFSIFKPFGNFKDYIANPKDNGYQSLHTAIILENGDPVEVQIRTFEMHNYAEYGLAAHWAYKANKKVKQTDQKINYIRSILEMYKEKSNDELMDVLKTDVYLGKIFVQSPMGKILEFPEGSTPIDFAYAIHSKIGNTCTGAKINGKMVPLNTPLDNGDVVEIITNANSKGPSRDWLKICKTAAAKSKINTFFKKEMKDENIKKGKSILETQAKLKNINLSRLMNDEFLNEVYERYSFSGLDEMYSSIGYGGINSNQILNKLEKLYNDKKEQENYFKESSLSSTNKNVGNVSVRGYKNMLIKFAKCCNPVPGDKIMGYISRGKGVTIHREDCPTLNACEFDRIIECEWNSEVKENFIGAINIIAKNSNGVLATISKKISDNKISIASIVSKDNADGTITIGLHLIISSKNELEDIMTKIKSFAFVYDVYRAG